MTRAARRQVLATVLGAVALVVGIVAAHVIRGIAIALIVAVALTAVYYVIRWLQWEAEQIELERQAVEAMREYVRTHDRP